MEGEVCLRKANFFTMKPVCILIFTFLLNLSAWAQTSSIQGKIADAKTGETLPGANVVIQGTTIGSMTDMEGRFVIKNLQAGTYTLVVSYVGYVQQTIKDVKVMEGRTANLDVKLNSSVNELNTAEVVAARVTHTENAVLAEMKQSEQIVNGVSAQQIARSQDRSATDVVKRIPGVTIIENRFVMVRGLSERYNAVLLNNTLTPSAEVDKKAFSFDIIPSSLIDRLLIYKSGAPELPGEFAGGVIKVFTRNIPDENQLSVGYSVSHRAGTTFKDFYTGATSNTDWLGFDDGMRSLPENFPSSLTQITNSAQVLEFSKSLPNNWFTEKTTAIPDQRFNLTLSRKFNWRNVQIGNITNINYSNTQESYFSDNFNYNAYDITAGKSDTIYRYDDYTCNAQVRGGILHNWSFQFSNHHKIEFRNLFNQTGTNQTTLRSGYNLEEGSNVKNYSFYYQQRSVYSGQLGGQHEFNLGNTKVDWTGGYAITRTKEPDFRRVRTKTASINDFDKYYIIIAPNASTLDAGRFYSELNEDIITAAANLEQAVNLNAFPSAVKVRTGFYAEEKTRDFNARWLSYKRYMSSQFNNALLELPIDQAFAPENMNETGFKLEEGTNPYDNYSASNNLLAAYLGLSIPVTDKLNVSGGARAEKNRMQLKSRRYTGEPVNVDIDQTKILPSANISYQLNLKWMVRAGYAQTINRPEFRELAPFSYYDFTFNNVIYGNDSLQTPSINNYDFRVEWYPSNGEMISFGVFYKTFKLPIERFFVPGTGSGGTRNFTFNNADKSVSRGAEVEMRKSLEEVFPSGFLNKLSLYMNAAFIDSKVELGNKAVGQQTERPMMGQSPFIVNAGLYYHKKESKLQASLIYNVIGKRIYAVGTYGTPDIYEMPRHLLDFTLVKGIGRNVEVKAGIQDILSQHLILRQDSDENGKVNLKDELILDRKPGRYITIGFNVKI